MAPKSQSATYFNGLRHFALLLLVATVIVIALLWSAGPIEGDPWFVLRMSTNPNALPFFGSVIVTALALEIGVRIVAWAARHFRLDRGRPYRS